MCGLNSQSYLKTFKKKFVLKAFTSVKARHSVVSDSLWPHGLWSARLFCPYSPGGNTGVCCHFLFQGIFLTQGSNPGLLHCMQVLYYSVTGEALYFYDPSYIPGCLAFCSHDLIDSNTKLWFICTVFPTVAFFFSEIAFFSPLFGFWTMFSVWHTVVIGPWKDALCSVFI